MKTFRHFRHALALLLVSVLLAGCNALPGENLQVEELLRAPRLSGDYGAVQTALNDWLGESAQLKYPMQGDLLSPFLMQDLDGDGRQDAAVLYTTAQSSNVCIAILQKDDADIWHVRQNVEGLADTVESVGLAQLQPGDATQLVVGYTAAQGDHYLAVYSYTDGVLSTILEQQYQQYLVEDITGGGNEDLILMSTLEDGGVQIELLTVDKDGSFQQVAVMGLSANRFAGCASVAAGVGADGRHYLVLDGWTGISGNNLASVLLRFDEDTQQMVPADQISTEKLYTASLRNVSSLVSQDLDGDGEQDAAVFYTTALTSNVCVAFLRKNSGGAWQVSQTVEGLADSVDNVRLAQLQDGNAVQLVVGYLAAQGDSYLAVYSYEHGEVNAILEQSYEQYLVEDITGGGNEDLILMSTLEDGGVQIELLTVDKDGSFQQVAVMALSGDKFSGCAAVAAGLGADGKHYLVLDGWTGISGNNLASVLLRFDDESQQMVPASQIASEELYNASLRNVPSLVSRDLDGDGTVEIPTQPDEAGLLNMSQSRRMDFIVWMDYTSPEPEKSFGLLDEESSCYIELPAEWEGNLMLTDSAEGEEAVELRTVDEGKLVLTMRLVPSSESAAGWTRLGVVASRQMQAKFGPDVVLKDQSYRLSRSLYRLN